ncbi:D-hexose-6-phosphate mutarotase [Ornithinimicrobium sp. LYQ121]|uniref:D-hexose-6-phosphate mutarotase n=1 Tax=Ornithinimicrobium sp. LYQ121 TaxID=3378801 RepID=UPI003851F1A1
MSALLPRLHVAGPSRLTAYDFGAHLAEWSVDGVPVVWCSEHAVVDGSAPIRGGVPLCFPWFAAGPEGDLSPSHGVVRTATWRPVAATGAEVWAWELTRDEVTDTEGAEHVPGDFQLRYAVSAPPGDTDTLDLSLKVTNPGTEELRAEVALHTYLHVEDVRQVELLGLEDATYLDKVTGRQETQAGPVRITGETDRVYARSGRVVVEDRAALRHLEVDPRGAAQTVVWNPWADKAARLTDLGDEEWLRFVCVETVACGDRAMRMPPGGTSEIGARITVAHRPGR